MATEIIMPKAGMAMETGTIIEWNVEVGDRIEVGDEILEIETDKVAMPVEAETAGRLLSIVHHAGDVVPVTRTIGWIGEEGERAPEGAATETPSASSNDAPSVETAAHGATVPARENLSAATVVDTAGAGAESLAESVDGRTKATPAARRRAVELAVDIARVMPSGPAGEVRLIDVEAIERRSSPATPLARTEANRAGIDLTSVRGSGPGGRILRRDVVEQGAVPARSTAVTSTPSEAVAPVAELAGDTRVSLTGMRRVIAQRMSESHHTIPPVTLNAVARVDVLMRLRRELNGAEAGRSRFSVNDFILLAAAKAVAACPWMRVSLDGDEIVHREAVNIGMAVALEQGLVVPVIHDAADMTLSRISERARELGRRARERKLEVADMRGGTFSVSNLGMYGITTFTPMINPPEAAILGVGVIREELERRDGGEVAVRSVMDLSLTIDHRLIDGAQGAIFLQRFVALIEAPATILV
ncbi:MAG: 2-oxo acid dehydrogenase subunit E2 [Spirochaetales bacterium]|nr:2-oxo acid dehydrogenase subunit E2 [Spirochaetales bacterium]